MKRPLLGLLAALTLALAGGTFSASAATEATFHGPGRGPGGQVTATIATTASTTFEVNRKAGSLSDITAGMFVRADGTKGAGGVLTATRVLASSAPQGGPPPRGGVNGVGGQVTAIDGTTITVK